MRKLRCVIYALLIIVIMSPGISAQENNESEHGSRERLTEDGSCAEAPTELIRVTVQQISKKEPAYVFLLTNLSELPVWSFIVGEGRKIDHKLQVSHLNIPTKMESPEGWESNGFPGERFYYYWVVKDLENKDKMIQPGKSVSDFRVYLPEDTRKGPTFFGNGKEEPIQEKFKDLPFKVGRFGGPCLWGTIKTVDYID